ncbi:hypothetical protein GGR56DRAFT_198929 [Xylariaceae sp. FL0804]|nr:hypothetical protein GGR56DRAFT_198929 [Xylariaceae sp. FL0804]
MRMNSAHRPRDSTLPCGCMHWLRRIGSLKDLSGGRLSIGIAYDHYYYSHVLRRYIIVRGAGLSRCPAPVVDKVKRSQGLKRGRTERKREAGDDAIDASTAKRYLVPSRQRSSLLWLEPWSLSLEPPGSSFCLSGPSPALPRVRRDTHRQPQLTESAEFPAHCAPVRTHTPRPGRLKPARGERAGEGNDETYPLRTERPRCHRDGCCVASPMGPRPGPAGERVRERRSGGSSLLRYLPTSRPSPAQPNSARKRQRHQPRPTGRRPGQNADHTRTAA